MFVRFKERSLNIWADKSLEVILVNNRRVGVKTKQECVKYLAAIRLSQVKHPLYQSEFWRKVRGKLDTLTLPQDVRNSVEEKISVYVPMPEEMEKEIEYRVPHSFREKMSLTCKRLKRKR